MSEGKKKNIKKDFPIPFSRNGNGRYEYKTNSVLLFFGIEDLLSYPEYDRLPKNSIVVFWKDKPGFLIVDPEFLKEIEENEGFNKDYTLYILLRLCFWINRREKRGVVFSRCVYKLFLIFLKKTEVSKEEIEEFKKDRENKGCIYLKEFLDKINKYMNSISS